MVPDPMPQTKNDKLIVGRFSHLFQPRSFGRFMLVGAVNTFVGVIAFPALFGLYGNKSNINLLLTISSVFCATFSYFTHRILTFQSKGAYHLEIGKFCLLTLAIYLINLAVLNTVPVLTGVHPVVAQIATTVVLSIALMILNYFGMNGFVFVLPRPILPVDGAQMAKKDLPLDN